jgi:REP element-mobilizing transposase RayT
MSHSFTQINIHLIFSTKNREPWLTKQIRPRAFAYLAQVARKKGGSNVIAGGFSEHAHLLFELDPSVALADIVRDIKANGSRWIRSTFQLRDFAWQEGYTAFSVSRSLRGRVWKYIEGQEEHHKMVSFVDELKKWLAMHGRKFEERMLD